MLKTFLKNENILFMKEKNIFELMEKILKTLELNCNEETLEELYQQFKLKINLFPTTIGQNNMILHLYNPKIKKLQLNLIVNNRPISIHEKSKTKFTHLFLLVTNSKNSHKYSKLKGRIIRVLEDTALNQDLKKMTESKEITALLIKKEESFIDIIQHHLILSAKDSKQSQEQIDDIQINL